MNPQLISEVIPQNIFAAISIPENKVIAKGSNPDEVYQHALSLGVNFAIRFIQDKAVKYIF